MCLGGMCLDGREAYRQSWPTELSSQTPIPWHEMDAVSSLVAFVKADLPKLLRFAAVSVVTVPLGMFLFWLFRKTMHPVAANLLSVIVATIPNYILNRYWVWNRRGSNSVSREIAPFWLMALLGAFVSTTAIWIANFFTDEDLVFLALIFCSFGVVWVLKFFVLEKYLFGSADASRDHVEARA